MKKILLIILAIIALLALVFIGFGLLNPTLNTQSQVEVNAPLEKAWAIFDDESQMSKWLTDYKSMKVVKGELNAVGSEYEVTFDNKGKDLVMTEIVKAYEPQKRFAFEVFDSSVRFNVDITFEEKDGKTIITEKMSGGGENIFIQSMMALFKGSIASQKQEMYNTLKTLIENS